MNSSHSEHRCHASPVPCNAPGVTDRAVRRHWLASVCAVGTAALLWVSPAVQALDEGASSSATTSSATTSATTVQLRQAATDTADAEPDPRDPLANARQSFEHPVKYAIYSPAWHLSSNAGLRIMAHNQSDEVVELDSITFRDETGTSGDVELSLDMTIPAQGWAELQLPYRDLLSGNDCVDRTLQEDWHLVEISNYTLNPSVRGLIIENTRQFRIYQCVRSVRVSWHKVEDDLRLENTQWLMYHFERIPL